MGFLENKLFAMYFVFCTSVTVTVIKISNEKN